MKFRNLVVIIALILTGGYLKAQVNTGWLPVLLSNAGTADYRGVEGYYQVICCNSKEVVQLKLINHNNYTIKAGWQGVVIDNNNQKLYGNNQLDSIQINANSQVVGDCTGNTPTLTHYLSDFSVTSSNLKQYIPTNFDYIIKH